MIIPSKNGNNDISGQVRVKNGCISGDGERKLSLLNNPFMYMRVYMCAYMRNVYMHI